MVQEWKEPKQEIVEVDRIKMNQNLGHDFIRELVKMTQIESISSLCVVSITPLSAPVLTRPIIVLTELTLVSSTQKEVS